MLAGSPGDLVSLLISQQDFELAVRRVGDNYAAVAAAEFDCVIAVQVALETHGNHPSGDVGICDPDGALECSALLDGVLFNVPCV